MISRELVESQVKQVLSSNETFEGMFIVETSVSESNEIFVVLDGYKPVTLDHCVALNTELESKLNREVEDFEIKVASAGLGFPFKVPEQYKKYLGQEVEVLKTDGKKEKGILLSFSGDSLTLEVTSRVKVEGKKKKQVQVSQEIIALPLVKSTKAVISF